MSHRFTVTGRRVLAAASALLLTCVPAAAQDTRPGRAYRGLFGPDERNAAEVLSVTGQMGTGYETGLLVDRHPIDGSVGNAGFFKSESVFSLFAGGISYLNHTDRLDFTAGFQSAARDYSRFAMISSHLASSELTMRLGRGTTVTGFGRASYQPWGNTIYSAALTDPAFGQVVSPIREVAVLNGSYWTYSTGGSIAQQLSRRSTVSANYTYDVANFTGLTGNFEQHAAGLRYTHGLTRNLGWHVGYSYTNVRFGGQPTAYRSRGLDAGLDFNRSLSLTRRTQVGFSSGFSALDSNVTLPLDRQGTQYGVTGAAWLNREISRTWNAVVSYNRNVAFFESLRIPYFYDSLSVGIGGLMSRRVGLRSTAGATYGDVGRNTELRPSNRFVTGVADTTLTIALTRHTAVGVQYAYLFYSIDNPNAFWTAYTPDLGRHIVLVSVKAWVPIIERGRRGNAPR